MPNKTPLKLYIYSDTCALSSSYEYQSVSLLNKNYNYDQIENRNEFNIKDCSENILVFTDGSKDQNGHTDFGITFSEEELEEISEPLPTYSSIYQAEAIAIWKACEIIKFYLAGIKSSYRK